MTDIIFVGADGTCVTGKKEQYDSKMIEKILDNSLVNLNKYDIKAFKYVFHEYIVPKETKTCITSFDPNILSQIIIMSYTIGLDITGLCNDIKCHYKELEKLLLILATTKFNNISDHTNLLLYFQYGNGELPTTKIIIEPIEIEKTKIDFEKIIKETKELTKIDTKENITEVKEKTQIDIEKDKKNENLLLNELEKFKFTDETFCYNKIPAGIGGRPNDYLFETCCSHINKKHKSLKSISEAKEQFILSVNDVPICTSFTMHGIDIDKIPKILLRPYHTKLCCKHQTAENRKELMETVNNDISELSKKIKKIASFV
jgi:hypothetical protein